MAYNLQSLITILQQILNPTQTRWIINQNKPQLESILEKAESLQQLLEKCPLTKIESLERRIRDAAYRAEDVIESRMVHQMLSAPQGVDRSLVLFTFFTPYLEQVMQQLGLQQDLERVTVELDFAMQQVVKLMKVEEKMMLGGSGPTPDHVQQSVKLVEVKEKKMQAGAPFSSSKNDLVGVDADLMHLKDVLTNMERKMEIISITGMGGTGKSTFARKAYHDPFVIIHFDYCGWATISQDTSMRDILSSLIGGPNEKSSNELLACSVDELKVKLYKRLLHQRYMIVLDDVWSTEFLDDIRTCLPDNNNGSRIVITTRLADIGLRESNTMHFQFRLLSHSESWDLLRQIVFGEEDCPLELQGIGTKIAGDCKGVHLVIKVIGGFLSKVERSREVWEHFLTEFKASINVKSDEGDPLLNTLYWSYNHLPIHLKPCFLYMGAFQGEYNIKGSRLISLWLAEGFVKANGDKSLEEVAMDYLKALVDRNLLSVRRRKSNGEPMSYSIHEVLWDLCRRKADEEKFRCVSFQPSYEMEDENASPHLIMPLARSFICTWKKIKLPIFSVLTLLRVLDVMRMAFQEFPQEILQLVNLRYLAIYLLEYRDCGICKP